MGRRRVRGLRVDDAGVLSAAGHPTVSGARAVARVVRDSGAEELALPRPSTWSPGGGVAGCTAALAAAVAVGLPRVRLGDLVFRAADPVDVAILELLLARAQAIPTTTRPFGASAPAATESNAARQAVAAGSASGPEGGRPSAPGSVSSARRKRSQTGQPQPGVQSGPGPAATPGRSRRPIVGSRAH